MRRLASTFLVMFLWDWVATASIRYIANGELAAIPLGTLLTAFWWVAVSNVSRGWWAGLVACLGAAAGTALGLYVP